MKLDVRSILSGETDRISIDYTLSSDDLPKINDVEFADNIHVTGEFKNTAGYMTLSLVCAIGYKSVCARCLKELEGTLNVNFEKTVCEEGDLQNQENDDYIEISDCIIDVDEAIIEDIILNFPAKLLCVEDCKGLCPKCGADLNEKGCSCVTKEIDPRLAPLLKFFENNDNN